MAVQIEFSFLINIFLKMYRRNSHRPEKMRDKRHCVQKRVISGFSRAFLLLIQQTEKRHKNLQILNKVYKIFIQVIKYYIQFLDTSYKCVFNDHLMHCYFFRWQKNGTNNKTNKTGGARKMINLRFLSSQFEHLLRVTVWMKLDLITSVKAREFIKSLSHTTKINFGFIL